MIPLTRGLGRSECRQPYPCKYHNSQWSWALMFNVKLELGLDVNIKVSLINLQLNFQGPPKSRLGLDADVELSLVNCALPWKLFWV